MRDKTDNSEQTDNPKQDDNLEQTDNPEQDDNLKQDDHLEENGKRDNFQAADLEESTAECSNPARGWYQIHTFFAEQEPDFEELRWCLHPEDTLAFLLIDIGHFRDRDLDREALERISRILVFFGTRGYDCIVRIVYDHEGRASAGEPFSFSQVKSHLEQIGPLMAQFTDTVYVLQGMLVGSWGEMHSSRFLSEPQLCQMAEILRRYRGKQTYLAVRRPVYWRMLHGDQKGKRPVTAEDMGIFDDGILGSKSNLGTFGTQCRTCAAWNSPWRRSDELSFEAEIGCHAPNGGEVVYSPDYLRELYPAAVKELLIGMQVTYLNRAHDTRMLEVWKEWKYPGTGVWAGKSFYDYVSAHLGYRFLVRGVRVRKEKREKYFVEIEIENTGFAGGYQEAELCLEYVDNRGIPGSRILEFRIKGWKRKERRTFACTAEAGKGRLYLAARRKRDKAAIRFGNVSDVQGRVFLGEI